MLLFIPRRVTCVPVLFFAVLGQELDPVPGSITIVFVFLTIPGRISVLAEILYPLPIEYRECFSV